MDQEVAGADPVGHPMEMKMKFIRIGTLLINTTQIRKIVFREGTYDTPSKCSIYYVDGEWDAVDMDEAEFKDLLARIDNVNLLVR